MAAELGFNIVAHNRASKGLQAAAKDFQGLEKKASAAGKNSGKGFRSGFDKNIKGVGSKLKGGLKLGAAAAGAAAGALIVDGVKFAMDQAAVGGEIGAQLNLDPATTAEAARVAGRIYSDSWGESLDQVKQAAVGVVQNLNTEIKSADFQPLVTDALIFAEIFEQDVTRSIQTVGRMMKTGMVKDGREGFDTLTRLFQKAGSQTDDLLDTFTEYPVAFQRLGLDAQDAMGLLIQGLQGGARDSDKVADALKELGIKVADLSAAEGLKDLGLDAEKMRDAFAKGGPDARDALELILDKLRGVKDPAERARIGVELFGTQAEDMAGALNALDLSKARDEIGEVGGATRDAGKTATDSLLFWHGWDRRIKGIISGLISGDVEKFRTAVPGVLGEVEGALRNFSGSAETSMRRAAGSMNRAKGSANLLEGAIRSIPNKKRSSVSAVVHGVGRVLALRNQINALQDKTVFMTTRFRTSGSRITGLAHGGPVKRGQVALVGEEGPEIVRFSGAGEVIPNRESMQMMRGGGGGGMSALPAPPQRVVLELDLRGDADLVRFFRKAITARGGNVQKVLGS